MLTLSSLIRSLKPSLLSPAVPCLPYLLLAVAAKRIMMTMMRTRPGHLSPSLIL
jgi:hypothetical protein